MKPVYAIILSLSMFAACGPPPDSGLNHAVNTSLDEMVTGTVLLDYIDTWTVPRLSHAPDGISAGADGTLYLCDTDGGRVIMLDRNGTQAAIWDGPDTRNSPAFAPVDVSAAGGIEVYVLDSGTSRIIRLDRNLRNAYTVYSPDQNRSLFGAFRGIAFNRTTGDLFVTDRDNGTVRRIDMLGGNIQTSGSFGQGRVNLAAPSGIDIADDGTIYIADNQSNTIAVQQHTGSTLTVTGNGILIKPVDVAALPDGRIAVAEQRGIVILDRDGTPLATAGFSREPKISPRSVAFMDGIIMVSDNISGGIVRFRMR